MTQPEFTKFVDKFHQRFPFKKAKGPNGELNMEIARKLKGLFFDFTERSVLAALQEYDVDHPDVNGLTFKFGDLLHYCHKASESEQVTFTWNPCDEAEFYADAARRQRYGLDEITIHDFALHVLQKPRVPNDHERLTAQDTLKKMGVTHTIHDVMRVQAENERAFDRYREIDRQAKLELKRRTRERGRTEQAKQAAAKDPHAIGEYARRARAIIERQASE